MDTVIRMQTPVSADPRLEKLRGEALALFDLPFNDLLLPRAYRASRAFRSQPRAALDAAVDQDRRLPRGLRLLPAGGTLSHGCRGPGAACRWTRSSPPRRPRRRSGATRFCMGAAWRGPKARDLEPVLDMVREVKKLGLEACCTLGMLKDGQAEQPARRGPRLLQPQPRHRARVLRRDHHDARLRGPPRHARARARRGHQRVLRRHRRPGRVARASAPGLLAQLASLDPQPESVPINDLVQVEGTPLAGTEKLPWIEFVRTIAVARILMPRSMVRLSAGRAGDGRGGAGAVLLRRAPTRSSTARSCSRRATPTSSATTRSSPRSASPRPEDPMTSGIDRLASGLEEADRQRLRRTRRVLDSPQGARVRVGGRELLELLQQRLPRPRQPSGAARRGHAAIDEYGVGAGASPLVSGYLARASRRRGALRGASSACRARSSFPAATPPTSASSRRSPTAPRRSSATS